MSADVFTPEKRSEVMSRIRSRGNKDTEMRLISLMKDAGIKGWRRHVLLTYSLGDKKSERVRVRPDFIFRSERVAVFVDGCFWHGCPKCYVRPKGNRKFWDTKVTGNRIRDRKATNILRKKGWKVLRIWECNLVRERAVTSIKMLSRVLVAAREKK